MGSFFYHAQHGHGAHPQHTGRVPNAAPVERHLHNLPLGCGQAAVGNMSELKNRPLTGGVLTAIALRAIGLFPSFYDLGALTVRTGHLDRGHDSIPIHKNRAERRHYYKY